MKKVTVHLMPVASRINLPTVLKTAILPGETTERLFIATQTGEIFYSDETGIKSFLDISGRILKLGATKSGYDERGLIGLAFHPDFTNNGRFYLHYSLAGTEGPGALSEAQSPNPCDSTTLNREWVNRETYFNHIDTVEEWILQANRKSRKKRTLLNIRRPFFNHNGVNSLNFSPETGKLVLMTGDGGSGYDPFNLSQNDLEIAGKVIEIDADKDTSIPNPPVVTHFNELPTPIKNTLTVIAKGIRNSPGISFKKMDIQYTKYVGNVGQDLVEAVYSFVNCQPIPITRFVQPPEPRQDEVVNFGWRGWEGIFPTTIIKGCTNNANLNEKILAYYDEAVETSTQRLPPFVSYFHQELRPGQFSGTALTGVQVYMGNEIPDLTGCILFSDLAKKNQTPVRGVLAYSKGQSDCKLSNCQAIDVNYDFGTLPAFYVSLGTNSDQTRLFLGVYGSTNVLDFRQGSVFEVVK